jgi:DNA-binding XRE family transcriptional regulator
MMIDEQLLYILIGGKLQELRKNQDPPMTQEALGIRVGLTRASIAQIETGRQKPPLHTLYNLFILLGVKEPRNVLPTVAEATTVQAGERVTVDGDEMDVPPKSAKFIHMHTKSKKR